jgi:hypothetical protein
MNQPKTEKSTTVSTPKATWKPMHVQYVGKIAEVVKAGQKNLSGGDTDTRRGG